jgi:hypothetical protein
MSIDIFKNFLAKLDRVLLVNFTNIFLTIFRMYAIFANVCGDVCNIIMNGSIEELKP